MSYEAVSIILYVLLIVALLVVQMSYTALVSGFTFGFSNRDDPQPKLGKFGIRINNTIANMKEGAVIYLPLATLCCALDISNGLTTAAALMTIVSRTLYVPIYLAGITVVRSFVWAPSFIAVPLMAWGMLGV
jgi:uncharacterized MAPEG superfamily protein